MKKPQFKNIFCQSAAVLALGLAAKPAQAISVDWSGTYRFEYTEIDRTSMDDPKLRKAYFLNHLTLSPKIVAVDGFNVMAKFDVLPSEQYPDSQLGQTFGRGPNKAFGGTSSSADDSALAGDKQGSTTLRVSQLYMNFTQEYGSLVVGRAPLDFGLGISHSAGNGAFDHWYSTLDMVGYKVFIGNFYLMPIFGTAADSSVSQGHDVRDMIWNAEYSNPETESSIGIFHQTRTASEVANDAPAAIYGANTTTGGWKTQHINLYFSRGFEAVKFRLEAGFESGSTGMFRNVASGTEEVSLNGYGIAVDMDFPQKEGRLQYNLKAGIASGDNPTTTNYEGFHFHRNYDVAFLLFNHPMGRYDLLRSAGQRGSDRQNCAAAPCAPYSTDEALDDESISNAVYLSPRASYTLNDKWVWTNALTWAQLQTNPLAASNIDVEKDLGFEWDTGLVYKPHERFMWVNELGMLFPGSAWAGGTSGYGNGFTYGFASKAAISF